ncbi:MAG: LysM peptidoglycan-binding domain-containing protein [Chitinophagaceae bacterium]|nr:LysM peptidoglycan-binding domain-containing protein [Chitinophagaceae bacterium]
MNMRMLLIVFFCFAMHAGYTQSPDLMVQGAAPSLYLEHAVAAKETWYSIGRIYNISPKEIAPFNNLAIDKPLAIGQLIRIPLSASNFAQSPSKAADELYVPVFHVVQDKEWMYRLSVNYKTPVENLEKWNNITKDQVKPGIKMIVGYLKVKGQSSLASRGSSTMKNIPADIASGTTRTETPASTTPAKTTPATTRPEPVQQGTTVSTPAATNATTVASAPEKKPQQARNEVSASGGGYFRSMYGQSGKSAAGTAGVFKSTSGWQDGKYYALMNNVPVGTIIKISPSSSSDKAVYAKVLGSLAEMKENTGLSIRLSDAAAAQLGTADITKFPVEVRY